MLDRLFLISVIGAGLWFFMPSSLAAQESVEPPPNIVVIFMDDMGYADIGPFGADKFQTPHLDRMAREGRKFSDFVTSTAVCSASRAALLTGCYHRRVGISGALGPGSRIGIHADETTLAELCKQRDYATACFGKWHLGTQKKFLPLQHGFDHYYGLPYSNDMWPFHPAFVDLPADSPKRKNNYPDLPLIEGNQVIDPEVTAEDQRQLTTDYTQKAVDFIDQNHERPFFLYVPHSMVHVPLFVSEKFSGKSGAGLLGDVVMEVDWSVGEILKALRRHQIEKNTLVIFTSDNGPWLSYGDHAGSAHPLREGKGTMFDNTTIIYMPETGAGHHGPDNEAPMVIMSGGNSKLDIAGRYIRLPFHGTEGHRTLSNWYTTLLNAYGNPVEHYGDLDLEMSRRKLQQTGPIDRFLA